MQDIKPNQTIKQNKRYKYETVSLEKFDCG